MKTWIRNIVEAIRVNFWLIPSAMVVSAIILSFVMLGIDVRLDGQELLSNLGWKLTSGIDGARQVLATIATSMITITSITFSLTILSMQLASSQFGPRLLRNFMADRGTQVVLGTYIATFTYCLLILRSIHTEDDESFVPHLSLLVAVFLAISALGVLIYFIHHTAKSIQADHVIRNVSHDLTQSLKTLFPAPLGRTVAENPEQILLPPADQAAEILSKSSGYLQAVDGDRLMELAGEHDLTLQLTRRPGRYILRDTLLARVWPRDRVDDDLADTIRKIFVLGGTRSPVQDAEFAVDQLVEIAVRAMSTGINDPDTAVHCVDHLAAALMYLTDRSEPSPIRADPDGRIRIYAERETFGGIADRCFNQIRQAGRNLPPVLIRVLDRIIDLAPHIKNGTFRESLQDQVEMIEEVAGKTIPASKDLDKIRRRCETARKLLDASAITRG